MHHIINEETMDNIFILHQEPRVKFSAFPKNFVMGVSLEFPIHRIAKNGRLPIARKLIARMPIARMAFEVYFSKMYLQHIDRMGF